VVYICIGIAVLICLGTFAIKTLLLKQQLKQGGERLNRLRRELAELNTSNEALRTTKNQLTSIPALKKAIAGGIIDLKPIEPRFVLNVPADRRTVANTVALPGFEGGR
jgi:hypothetical protein